jgi:protein TonB
VLCRFIGSDPNIENASHYWTARAMNHISPGFRGPVSETEICCGFVRPVSASMARAFTTPPTVVSPARRGIALLVAIAVQAMFVGVWLTGRHIEAPPRRPSLVMVDIAQPATPEKPQTPPLAPRLVTPQINTALPAMPQIAMASPAAAVPSEASITMPATPAPPIAPAAEAYENLLLRHLNAHKRYPAVARARHQEGVVTIRFTMDREGRVLARGIERSSRVAALDGECLMLLERAQPLPPPPPSIAGDRIELVVPINFLLR